MLHSVADLKIRLTEIFEAVIKDSVFIFEESLDEVAMKRVVRGGKIVRKVKQKRKGFKVVRVGNTVRFKRMTQMEKRNRRRSARKAWKVGKNTRKTKAKRTMIRSKVRMRQLYGK